MNQIGILRFFKKAHTTIFKIGQEKTREAKRAKYFAKFVRKLSALLITDQAQALKIYITYSICLTNFAKFYQPSIRMY